MLNKRRLKKCRSQFTVNSLCFHFSDISKEKMGDEEAKGGRSQYNKG